MRLPLLRRSGALPHDEEEEKETEEATEEGRQEQYRYRVWVMMYPFSLFFFRGHLPLVVFNLYFLEPLLSLLKLISLYYYSLHFVAFSALYICLNVRFHVQM